jgi:CubicO group peptidase (beta-lactamase class C family)
VFNGRQLVSREWIATMTEAHTGIPGRTQRYGYLRWIDANQSPEMPRTRLQMSWGNGGNFVVVMPELNAVYVSVGRRYNQPDATEPLRWLGERILVGWPPASE